MKKILQAMDGVASKPVEGANDMKKFVSIINEGSNPHKIALPVQMAMQHYQKPQPAQIEKKKYVKDGIRKFFREVETQTAEQIAAEQQQKRQLINQYAQVIAERVLMKEGKETARDKWNKASAARDKKHTEHEKEIAKLPVEKRSGSAIDALEKHLKDVKENEIPDHSMGFTGGVGPGMQSNEPTESQGEGDTVKNSLHTIIRVATHLDKRLNSDDQFPEWVSEKIGAIKELMVSVMDYEISDQELHGVEESHSAPHHSPEDLGGADAYYGRPADHANHDLTDHNDIRAYYHGYRAGEDMHDKSNYDESLRNENPCWKGYHPVGTKKKGGRTVPNCVPKE